MSFNSIRVNDTDTNYTHSIFDISDYNSGDTYLNLSSALAAVPENKQQGGMTVRYLKASDTGESIYVQYRLMSPIWSTDVSDWFSEEDAIKIIEKKTSEISTTITSSDDEKIEIVTDDGKEITSISAKKSVDENEVMEFKDDADNEFYAKIGNIDGKKGVFAQNFYDLQGHPIQGILIDTENEVMIINGRKYKLIPFIETT